MSNESKLTFKKLLELFERACSSGMKGEKPGHCEKPDHALNNYGIL